MRSQISRGSFTFFNRGGSHFSEIRKIIGMPLHEISGNPLIDINIDTQVQDISNGLIVAIIELEGREVSKKPIETTNPLLQLYYCI